MPMKIIPISQPAPIEEEITGTTLIEILTMVNEMVKLVHEALHEYGDRLEAEQAAKAGALGVEE